MVRNQATLHVFSCLFILFCAGTILGCSDPDAGAPSETENNGEQALSRGTGLGSSGGVPGAGGGVPSHSTEIADARVSPGADISATTETDSQEPGEEDTGEEDVKEENDTIPFAYECDPGDEEECITECGTTGIRICSKIWGPCIPPEEICNGLDDDCDGQIDNGLADSLVPEICDGIDNDCDGFTDEEVYQPCPCDSPEAPFNICVDGEFKGCPEVLSTTTTILMPALAPNCPWGIGDNLNSKSGSFAARVEQSVPFNLEPGAKLCSFSMTGNSPNFYFDDHLMLLFNGIPLIGSFHFTNAFSQVDGLPYYEWSEIVGQSAKDFGQQTHCLSGHIECSMPGTQSNGEVSLSFDEQTNELLANTGDATNHQFTIIVTGDNDPPVECHHTGLSMIVDYTYVLIP